MGKKEVIKIIRNSKPEMESHYGVQRLGLFGSYVNEKQSKRSDIDILVYRLVHLEELTQPIENESGNGESQRVSGHRWTSRLGLDRARTITELLLETEAEWRLFEELRASGVPFTVNSAGVPRYESTGYRGHALFRVKKNRTTATIQYYGASGFRIVLDEGNEEFAASIQRVRSIISD